MHLTATLNNKELTIVVGDDRPKKMIFDIDELPFIDVFEYDGEIYEIELYPDGLWIGQEGALQNYRLTVK